MVTNGNVQLGQLEDKTASDSISSESSTNSDTIESPLSYGASTSTWRASTSPWVGISKGEGDRRKEQPRNPLQEWRYVFLENKKQVRSTVAILISALPIIMIPRSHLSEKVVQGGVWAIITTLVLQEETSTGVVLKAAARIFGTVLGAIIGGLVGFACSWIISMSFFTRIVCALAMVLSVIFAYWLRVKIAYFRKNQYAAIILVVTTVIVYVSTVAGDLSIGLVRVAGIMVGVVVSLLCSLCVYPLSAESCLNEHFVNSSMDVNELITMVINMAKLRHVSTSAAPEESKSAAADLNDGNRVHEYDSEEPLTFEYDYRTDAVHTFASTCISKMISREDALIGIATHEYKAVWKEGRKLHWRSTPSEKYALLFKNLRRILYIVVHFHPYLHLDILSEDWDSDIIEHVEACLNTISTVLGHVVESRLSVWSPSRASIPFKMLFSLLNEGLKQHFLFSAMEVLKHNQPLEDSARKLLGYYELSDDPPYHFVLDDNSDRAHEEWFRNFSTSVFTSFAPHPKDNTSARASVDILLIDIAFRKQVMVLHCLELIFRAYIRTIQMLSTLSQLEEVEMLCS